MPIVCCSCEGNAVCIWANAAIMDRTLLAKPNSTYFWPGTPLHACVAMAHAAWIFCSLSLSPCLLLKLSCGKRAAHEHAQTCRNSSCLHFLLQFWGTLVGCTLPCEASCMGTGILFIGPQGMHAVWCTADSLVLHLQQLHDGHLPDGPRVHDPHAHAARRLCTLHCSGRGRFGGARARCWRGVWVCLNEALLMVAPMALSYSLFRHRPACHGKYCCLDWMSTGTACEGPSEKSGPFDIISHACWHMDDLWWVKWGRVAEHCNA